MKNANLIPHFVFTSSTIRKIVVVVFFAVMLNVINLGAFYKGCSIELDKAAAQADSQISNIFGTMNAPIKALCDLFKNKEMSSDKKDSAQNPGTQTPMRQAYLKRILSNSIEIAPLQAVIVYQKILFSDILRSNTFERLQDKNMIRYLLLFLMLLAVLPRGIPLKIKNIKILFLDGLAFILKPGFLFVGAEQAVK